MTYSTNSNPLNFEENMEAVIGLSKGTYLGMEPLPTKQEKFTVIRGPHIDKRSREQFELRTHKRVIDVVNPTSSTVDSLSRLSLPAGVGISIKM